MWRPKSEKLQELQEPMSMEVVDNGVIKKLKSYSYAPTWVILVFDVIGEKSLWETPTPTDKGYEYGSKSLFSWSDIFTRKWHKKYT